MNQELLQDIITVLNADFCATSSGNKIVINGQTIKPIKTVYPFAIKNVYYDGTTTVVLWEDSTKTVVKCQPGDIPNPEHGLAMAIIKKLCGNKSSFNNVFTEWLPVMEKSKRKANKKKKDKLKKLEVDDPYESYR